VYEDEVFRNLFSRTGQPALAPWRLALVEGMQFAEGLTDRQAADAVRGRLDWKDVLGLGLEDAGFDHSVLSAFRARLVTGEGEAYLLEALLKSCAAKGWLKAGGRQRTDSTHILMAVHSLYRVELVAQTFQYALNEVAKIAPEWLKGRVPVDWFERYSRKLDDEHLPKTEQERVPVAQQIGQDGQRLLNWVAEEGMPTAVQACSAIAVLREVWSQQYKPSGEDQVTWRQNNERLPSAQRIASPHDPEARYSTKNGLEWVGDTSAAMRTYPTLSPTSKRPRPPSRLLTRWITFTMPWSTVTCCPVNTWRIPLMCPLPNWPAAYKITGSSWSAPCAPTSAGKPRLKLPTIPRAFSLTGTTHRSPVPKVTLATLGALTLAFVIIPSLKSPFVPRIVSPVQRALGAPAAKMALAC
jgi:transposase